MTSKKKENIWQSSIEKFENDAIGHESNLEEAGYWGQGSSVDGSATFRGGPFGFGGVNQLAAGLSEPVKKLKKDQDKEAVYNIASQQRINRGYPAPQSISGFPGGESNSGIRSGTRVPNDLSRFAVTVDELESFTDRESEEQYFGYDDSDDEEKLQEQGAGAGWQGPQRGTASDQNYRDLPGWPRHNSIEKQGNYVPEIEGDEDGDGEEDDYLSDSEYVNDVLRLNGISIKPGHMKKLFGQAELEESVLYERTLYHGTSNEHLDSIKKYGLSGELGDFVKDAYGIELDEEEWEDRLEGITFAADRSNIGAAVGAMRYHVGKKLNKNLSEVDEEDLRQHGMLVIIRDVDESRKIKYPEDVEEGEWYHRPKDDQDYYGAYPMSVEPGDWFVRGGSHVDDILTGNKLIQFLRRVGGLEYIPSDERRRLIKLAVAYHGPKERKRVVQKVMSLPEKELRQQLRNYEQMAGETLEQQRKERYGGDSQKQRGRQLSFNFGESKQYSLKKLFSEAYVAPPYGPEPDRGAEHYKRGYWEETPQGDDWLIDPQDFSGGHAGMPAAEHSPGRQTYGQIGSPKDFVPEDWEQRHPKTKEEPISQEELIEFIESVVREALEEAYTGVDDKTGKGEPKGGSAAFQASRKKVFTYDEKHKPEGIEDLENYHMDE